jgi:hypothetical protein
MTRMKTKLGVQSIQDDRLLHLAATCIQCMCRCQRARFQVKQLASIFKSPLHLDLLSALYSKHTRALTFESICQAEKRAWERRHAAATKIQALWRGARARQRVKAQKQMSKVRRLAFFFTSVCFVKCFMTWECYTQV